MLLADNVEYKVVENDLIETKGLGEKWDSRKLDIIRIIKIEDALDIKYKETNVITPLANAESSEYIPWHITTQSILFCKVSENGLQWIRRKNENVEYGKHSFDQFWLPFSRSLEEVTAGDIVCIFNRRVNGWDGSYERPVIELLGAGGHLPIVWNSNINEFVSLSYKENLKKEFIEELNLEVSNEKIFVFGGFENPIMHELVILCGVLVDESLLPNMQQHAEQNLDFDTGGIYLGTFSEVIEFYTLNPVPFAGGVKSAPYNFPTRKDLMIKVEKYICEL